MIQRVGRPRISAFRQEPFRLLFPLGYAFLVLGLGIWSVDLAGELMHRETLHAILLGNGFLFSFAAGVLLTEVPRLQGTDPMGPIPLTLFLAFLAAMGAAALGGAMFAASVFQILASIVLCAYLGFGWLMTAGRRQPGPILAFTATLIAVAFNLISLPAAAGTLPQVTGRNAAVAGFQLFSGLFVMACLRWSKEHDKPTTKTYGIPITAGILVLSFIPEMIAAYSARPETLLRIGYLIRALWFAALLRRPGAYRSLFEASLLRTGIVTTGIGFLVLGSCLAAAFPRQHIAFGHMAFLMGFAWLIMAMATALVSRRLAALPKGAANKMIRGIGLALAAATAARLSAEAMDAYRKPLLVLAACLAFLPILVWAVLQFPLLADWDVHGNPESK